MDSKSIAPNLLEDKPEPSGEQAVYQDDPDAVAARVSVAVQMFERLARDPGVDVEKLERLISMQERILRHNAKSAFDTAFTQMQSDMPEIDEKGVIRNKAGAVQSRYALLEDIHKAIKPILQKHGFSLRHRTEWPDDRKGIIRIVGILSHTEGHSEESVFEAESDKSDYRSQIQSMGSTVSYGRRYTTIDLLNITTRGLDNDGQRQKEDKPAPPETDTLKYEDWWESLSLSAAKGLAAFDTAWECSDAVFKNYAIKHDYDSVKKLKETARVSRPYGKAAK